MLGQLQLRQNNTIILLSSQSNWIVRGKGYKIGKTNIYGSSAHKFFKFDEMINPLSKYNYVYAKQKKVQRKLHPGTSISKLLSRKKFSESIRGNNTVHTEEQ